MNIGSKDVGLTIRWNDDDREHLYLDGGWHAELSRPLFHGGRYYTAENVSSADLFIGDTVIELSARKGFR